MSRSVVVALLLAVLGIGGFLRLHRLDYPTMGGDVMVYYSICESGVRPAELLVHSPKYLGDLPPLSGGMVGFIVIALFLPLIKLITTLS